MPQQLSLYASIADADLKITLHTLVALTGMEPRPVFEHNLIWAPKHPFKPVLAAGQVNLIEQYRIRMAVDLVSYAKKSLGGGTETAQAGQAGSAEGPEEKTIRFEEVPDLILPYATTIHNANANANTNSSDKAEKIQNLSSRDWILHVAELPDAGKRKTISQALLSTQVVTGDTFALAGNLGYTWTHEYWVKGYQFIDGKVVIELFRLCEADPDHHEHSTGGGGKSKPVLRLLDPSGRWAIKAYTNVQAVTDIEAVTVGTQALERLKGEVAGLFELDQPDRNSFDTRIKKR